MSQPTHALVATFQMDPAREREQREGLSGVIMPSVASTPGFVSGHWTLDTSDGTSVAFITFDTAAAARSFEGSVRANADGQAAVGITLRSSRVVEVLAQA
jgi:hypothetical protein